MIKYLFPLWLGVLLYTILSVCFGAKGLSAFNQLEAEKKREMANINLLMEINDDLADTRDVLYNDKNNYYVPARELGYAARGERFVRIIGLGNSERMPNSPGQVITPVSPDFVPDWILQVFSFFITVTLLISIGTYDFLKYLKERETGTAYYRIRV